MTGHTLDPYCPICDQSTYSTLCCKDINAVLDGWASNLPQISSLAMAGFLSGTKIKDFDDSINKYSVESLTSLSEASDAVFFQEALAFIHELYGPGPDGESYKQALERAYRISEQEQAEEKLREETHRTKKSRKAGYIRRFWKKYQIPRFSLGR